MPKSPPAPGLNRARVVSVPWLGTSWVDRGADYRRRRLLAVAVLGGGALLAWAMSGGLVYGAWSEASVPFRAGIVVWTCAGLVWGGVFGWRLSGQLQPSAPRFPVLVLPLVLPFVCGALLAIVVAWCLPVVPVERTARAAAIHPRSPRRGERGRSDAAPE